MQKKLFLLDAYALIYRAHFAFTRQPRINSKGQNTSVPFGFTNTLLEIIQKQKPSHIGIVFDTEKPTFRSKIFPEYKAHREEIPEDVLHGVPIIKKIISGFNIPILEKDGYEADDVIGTIAKKAVQHQLQVYMMTSDKDFGQLVEKNILLYKPAYKGNAVHIMGVDEICAKWDIARVSQVTDILGLQGDTSDNIPGVPGIGPKTAATLLKKYNTVENIIASAHKLPEKQRKKIQKYKDQALLSKKLATISTRVPVSFEPDQFAYVTPNEKILRPIFEQLEFKAIAKRIFGSSPMPTHPLAKLSHTDTPQPTLFDIPDDQHTRYDPQPVQQKNHLPYRIVSSPEARAQLIAQLTQQHEFILEAIIKKQPLDHPELQGLAFFFQQNTHYVPLPHPPKNNSIIEEFRPVISSERITKVGHNLKRTILALKKYNITLNGKLFDTMLAHYLIQPESTHDIQAVFLARCGQSIPVGDDATQNLCHRLEATSQLYPLLQKELEEKGQSKLMSDIEAPLILMLADMEAEGIKIDEKKLNAMSKELTEESKYLQQAIYKIAGTEFNIASPKQVGEILFDRLKLIEKPKKTKTGQYATKENILIELAKNHHIVQKMLDFRACEKLRTTYVEALPKMMYRSDHRIHTDYKQTVAATGRLSSANPNLQNIPIRTEKGQKIREAFIPRNKDYLLMSADYSQIELRIAASFAQDKTMIEAFRQGRDIHAATAAKLFNTSLPKVTSEMRRKAKEVNFGILYGSGPFGLAQNLRITRSEAQDVITSYFVEFSAIRAYMDAAIQQAREKGYAETILGRRRYLPDIHSRNASTRGFAERNAINTPIQGSAADIIKIAMLHIHRWLQREKLNTKLLLQVHDELVFDLHKEEQQKVIAKISSLMKNAVQLDVTMEVEVGIGKNWLEIH